MFLAMMLRSTPLVMPMPSKAVVDCWLPTWLSIITIPPAREGGGVAADCHAAFDVVDLVADDGRVWASRL